MINPIKSLLIPVGCCLILFATILNSCQAPGILEEGTLTKYELLKKEVSKKMEEARETPIRPRSLDQDCDPPPQDGCFEFVQYLEDRMDITPCVGGTTDSCLLGGEMRIRICITPPPNSSVDINFEEGVFFHNRDCVTDDSTHFHPHHGPDWDCEHNVFYNFFMEQMMSVILDILDDDLTSCSGGVPKVLTRYTKDVCVIPCYVQSEKDPRFDKVTLDPCGNSRACCILTQNWCVDDNGNVNKTFVSKVQNGSCSPGSPPCLPTGWTNCRPRSCTLE